MDLSAKKRMAADILKAGRSRVKLDPKASEELFDAITRKSIKGLISQGAIWVEPKKGVSRGRYRQRRARLKKRGRGGGSKKGGAGARRGKKALWVAKVRALRSRLKVMRDRGEITGETFDRLYRQVKGGQIRSLRHLESLVRQIGRR